MAVYQKEKTLPMNFQILYSKDFDNPGLTDILTKNMKINQYGSLHAISNISHIRSLELPSERLLCFMKQDSLSSGKKMGKKIIDNLHVGDAGA